MILGLAPILKADLVDREKGIIADSKSGVSGAGKEPTTLEVVAGHDGAEFLQEQDGALKCAPPHNGFELTRLRTAGGTVGCNEFVFRRLGAASLPRLHGADAASS